MTSPPADWTVLSMMEWATSFFEQKEIAQPRLSIEWLLAHVLECKRLDLYMKYDRPLAPSELDILRPLVKRRSTHEPLQYITGSTDFYNSEFIVGPGVLIPRPETEQIIEQIHERCKNHPPGSILDIGTGSGCIAITLKQLFPEADTEAIDVSRDALKIAWKNAQKLETEITFHHTGIQEFQPEKQYDLIVSNPPYIPESEREEIDTEVKDYEPSEALFLPDPATIYSAIERFARTNLNPENGFLFLEIHEEYAPEITRLFDPTIWKSTILKDYSGKNRMLFCYLSQND
jgi:release factor glutamine methyltransferase